MNTQQQYYEMQMPHTDSVPDGENDSFFNMNLSATSSNKRRQEEERRVREEGRRKRMYEHRAAGGHGLDRATSSATASTSRRGSDQKYGSSGAARYVDPYGGYYDQERYNSNRTQERNTGDHEQLNYYNQVQQQQMQLGVDSSSRNNMQSNPNAAENNSQQPTNDRSQIQELLDQSRNFGKRLQERAQQRSSAGAAYGGGMNTGNLLGQSGLSSSSTGTTGTRAAGPHQSSANPQNHLRKTASTKERRSQESISSSSFSAFWSAFLSPTSNNPSGNINNNENGEGGTFRGENNQNYDPNEEMNNNGAEQNNLQLIIEEEEEQRPSSGDGRREIEKLRQRAISKLNKSADQYLRGSSTSYRGTTSGVLNRSADLTGWKTTSGVSSSRHRDYSTGGGGARTGGSYGTTTRSGTTTKNTKDFWPLNSNNISSPRNPSGGPPIMRNPSSNNSKLLSQSLLSDSMMNTNQNTNPRGGGSGTTGTGILNATNPNQTMNLNTSADAIDITDLLKRSRSAGPASCAQQQLAMLHGGNNNFQQINRFPTPPPDHDANSNRPPLFLPEVVVSAPGKSITTSTLNSSGMLGGFGNAASSSSSASSSSASASGVVGGGTINFEHGGSSVGCHQVNLSVMPGSGGQGQGSSSASTLAGGEGGGNSTTWAASTNHAAAHSSSPSVSAIQITGSSSPRAIPIQSDKKGEEEEPPGVIITLSELEKI
ncbi:unnamed protein product [Amoebophrya sp. A120]|nr:unnamed protein product [Amoebophrya sp. A120]|eukprot:GSA120T00022485001.1